MDKFNLLFFTVALYFHLLRLELIKIAEPIDESV